jgi:hypothetical protein
MSERTLTRRTVVIRAGDLDTVAFREDDIIQLSLYGAAQVTVHLTREQALQLSKNLEEVVAVYDATVDRYHEVCDEPAVSA